MKKAEQAARSKARLVDAATRLFAERGYDRTSVGAIAETAGISRGSIAWHFGSKEGLLMAAVDAAFAEWEHEILVPLLAEGRGPGSLRAVVQSHLEFVQRNSHIGRLIFVLLFESLGPLPELRPHYAALYRRLRAHGRDWLEAAAREGRVAADVDPEHAATAIVGALASLHYQWHLDPDGVDVEAAHAALATILERGLSPAR